MGSRLKNQEHFKLKWQPRVLFFCSLILFLERSSFAVFAKISVCTVDNDAACVSKSRMIDYLYFMTVFNHQAAAERAIFGFSYERNFIVNGIMVSFYKTVCNARGSDI